MRRRARLFGWANLFSGGALERFSIFALGIMPYISVAIILDLLKVAWPYLDELYKEGEAGRRKITQMTRYFTVALAVVQGTMIAYGLESMRAPSGAPVVYSPGIAFHRTDGHHGHRGLDVRRCGLASRSPSVASATASRW